MVRASLSAKASAARGEEQGWTREAADQRLPVLSMHTIAVAPKLEDVEKEASLLSFVHPIGGGFQIKHHHFSRTTQEHDECSSTSLKNITISTTETIIHIYPPHLIFIHIHPPHLIFELLFFISYSFF
ncbi:hypothetical protein PIB30_026283 [Stylosanthes scabra]|uniref:Uncharacterized protein n=1 Tax=Stylosanthes scabra TaxID=79078 RepID=A0ABU6TAJ0_9FABA|nr:hypothetical protein [Stylosanthes scabra]